MYTWPETELHILRVLPYTGGVFRNAITHLIFSDIR